MYINDVHILYYVLVGAIGLITGIISDWANKRLPDYKKIISKEFFTRYLKQFDPNYILIAVNAILNVGILYFLSANYQVLDLITVSKYLILTPMLLSVFVIDYKLQIIPNRLNLTMFEIGLVFTFILGMSNINIAIDMLLGMLTGGGIFLLITLIGGFVAGKEAMGFGDVKLMGALGLFFGWKQMIVITLIAFLLAAVISIGVMIFKRKTEYIPFGPFIVIATIITMCIPFEILAVVLFRIFSLGLYKG